MAEPLLTRYRMLMSVDGGVTWIMKGSQDAHNADGATKKFFGLVDEGVQVVAVTERSWRPVARAKKVVETFVNAPVDEDLPVVETADEPTSLALAFDDSPTISPHGFGL